MKIKYSIKPFNPDKIEVGDLVHHRAWTNNDGELNSYEVRSINENTLRITAWGREFSFDFPITECIKVRPEDKRYVFHE